MLVPDPYGFIQQVNTDFQYLRHSVFGTNQINDESNLNEIDSNEEFKKRKFDKIEFANTCFRLATVGVIAYSFCWYVNTLLKVIKLPVIVFIHFVAFEGYVFSKAYTIKKISISSHVGERVESWEKLLQDSRLFFIKSLFINFFSNNSANKVNLVNSSDRIEEIPDA